MASPHPFPKIDDGLFEALVDKLARWAPSQWLVVFHGTR